MIDSKPTFTSFAKQADILSRLHRELGFSEGDGGGEVLPLDELRKRNEADPASIVKADVRNSIAAEAEARWREFLAGRGVLEITAAASTRLLQAELDLSQKPQDRLAALEAHLLRMDELLAINQKR